MHYNISVFAIDQELQQLRSRLPDQFTLKARVVIEDRIEWLEAMRAQLTDEVPFYPMTDEAWEAESILIAKLYGN